MSRQTHRVAEAEKSTVGNTIRWDKSTTEMPAILKPESYGRWLGPDTDPHDLLITYPSELMMTWPTSTRVNSLDNDDPTLLDRTGD